MATNTVAVAKVCLNCEKERQMAAAQSNGVGVSYLLTAVVAIAEGCSGCQASPLLDRLAHHHRPLPRLSVFILHGAVSAAGNTTFRNISLCPIAPWNVCRPVRAPPDPLLPCQPVSRFRPGPICLPCHRGAAIPSRGNRGLPEGLTAELRLCSHQRAQVLATPDQAARRTFI